MIIRDAINLYRNQGTSQLLKKRTVFFAEWAGLDRQPATFNEVAVLAKSVLNQLLLISPNRPTYESGIVNAVQSHVKSGEDVAIVGGGWGVSAVVAARMVGSTGHVLVFEGAERNVRRVHETNEINSVSEIVDVEHSIIGPAISLNGNPGQSDRRDPSSIPSCETLILDCEGAEIPILEGIKTRPRLIIVETHGMFNSPKQMVMDTLQDIDYEIIEVAIADDSKQVLCEKNDIHVLVAVDSRHSKS